MKKREIRCPQYGNYVNFPPRIFTTFLIFFRENKIIKFLHLKMANIGLENGNFRKFRLELRSSDLNIISPSHIVEIESVEKPAMFAEV